MVRTLFLLSVLITAPALFPLNAAQADEYPPEFQPNFVNSCIKAGSSRERCDCMAREVRNTIPFKEYIRWEMLKRLNETPDRETSIKLADAVAACATR